MERIPCITPHCKNLAEVFLCNECREEQIRKDHEKFLRTFISKCKSVDCENVVSDTSKDVCDECFKEEACLKEVLSKATRELNESDNARRYAHKQLLKLEDSGWNYTDEMFHTQKDLERASARFAIAEKTFRRLIIQKNALEKTQGRRIRP